MKENRSKKSASSKKLLALKKTQEIAQLLAKSTMESQALSNSGDDRPAGEDHVLDLLEKSMTKEAGKKKAKVAGKRETR